MCTTHDKLRSERALGSVSPFSASYFVCTPDDVYMITRFCFRLIFLRCTYLFERGSMSMSREKICKDTVVLFIF